MKRFLIILSFLLITFIQIHAQGYSPTYFSKTDFEGDLRYLSQKVMRIHPKLLLPGESDRWNAVVDSININLPDSITYNDAYLKVSYLLATLHDSHSDFSFSYNERTKYMQNGGVTMPFTVRCVKDKLYIDQYFGDDRSDYFSGAEILSINSISSGEILKKMQSLSGSVSTYGIARYFGPYFWMYWGPQPEYRISVARTDSIFSITTKGVSTSDYFALKNKYYPEKTSKNCELMFYPHNTTAFMKIKRFSDDLNPFFQNAFDTIKYQNCKNLVIDVRNNPGGMGRFVDSLMNYLTKKSYTQYSYIALRVSNEVKKYYQKNKPDDYKLIAQLPTDALYKYDNDQLTRTPVAKRVFFEGNIFVLINHNTFSAAATLAGIIKKYKLGKVIGQPTGETIRYYANYLNFKLPQLSEEFSVSPEEFIQHGGDLLDQGVVPDILLKNEDLTNEEIVLKYCNAHY